MSLLCSMFVMVELLAIYSHIEIIPELYEWHHVVLQNSSQIQKVHLINGPLVN